MKVLTILLSLICTGQVFAAQVTVGKSSEGARVVLFCPSKQIVKNVAAELRKTKAGVAKTPCNVGRSSISFLAPGTQVERTSCGDNGYCEGQAPAMVKDWVIYFNPDCPVNLWAGYSEQLRIAELPVSLGCSVYEVK